VFHLSIGKLAGVPADRNHRDVCFSGFLLSEGGFDRHLGDRRRQHKRHARLGLFLPLLGEVLGISRLQRRGEPQAGGGQSLVGSNRVSLIHIAAPRATGNQSVRSITEQGDFIRRGKRQRGGGVLQQNHAFGGGAAGDLRVSLQVGL